MSFKNLLRSLFSTAVAVYFCGCMSAARQTRAFFKEPTHLSKSHLIADVPFVQQDTGQCGPATLAMAFRYYQHPIQVDQLAGKILREKNRGTLPSDMILAARSEGFMAVAIRGLTALLQEVEGGHPVIVFENLGLNWWPQWHYAIITGYDLDRRTVFMHSGPAQNKTESMDVFELSWSLADYWGMVLIPPGTLATTGSEIDHVTAAVALENQGFLDQAEISYQAILNRWPQSYVSLLGLGQISYKKNKIQKAVDYFQQAIIINPRSIVAKKNFAIAQSQLKK